MEILRCEYSSIGEKDWVIVIYDREAISPATVYFDTANGATIRRLGNSDNPHNNIIPSSVTFEMFLETSDHTGFYDDLVAGYEGRFLIYVHTYEVDGTTPLPMFHGFILHDLSPVEDRNIPLFQVTAVDGLQQLKNVRYEEDNDPLNNYLVKEYFYNSIYKLKWLDYFMSASDVLVEYVFQWASQYHTTTQILKDTRLANYFRKFKDGRLLYDTCYDLLDDLLKGFNARLCYYKGRYVIEQMGVPFAGTILDTYHQSYDGNTTTLISYTPLNYNYDTNDNINADTYPIKSWFPPLKSIDIRQRGDHLDNVLLPFTWTDTSATEEVIAFLDDPDGLTKLFFDSVFYAYMESPTGTETTEYYAKFELTVRNNGVYATRDYANTYDFKANGGLVANIYTSESITNITWSGTAPDTIEFWVKVGYLKDDVQLDYSNLLHFYKYMIFQTPVFTSGLFVSINLGLEGIYTDSDFTTAYVGGDTIKWGISRVNRAYIGHSLDDIKTSDKIIPVVVNSAATEEIEHSFSMGDYPSSASKQKIQVHNGTIWVDSNGWDDPDTVGTALFQYMAANEIAAFRKAAAMKLDISLFLDKTLLPLDLRRTITYKTKKMLALDLTIDTINDTTSGTYFEIAKDYDSTVGTPTTPNPPEITHVFGVSSQVGSTSSIAASTPTPPFYIEFSNVTTDSIDMSTYAELPDPDEVTQQSINLSIFLMAGGADMRFNNVAQGSLSRYEYRINYTAKTIEFNAALSGKFISVKAYNYYRATEPTA